MTFAILAQHFEREYHGATTLHPLGLLAVVLLGGAMLLVPRIWAILPMIVMACFVASAQRVVIAGFDFTLLRLMVAAGVLRILLWQEYRDFRFVALDYVVVAWAVLKTAVYTTQHGETGLVFMLGQSYDALGMYFLFRCLVRGWADVSRVALGFSIVALPVFAAFLIEWFTSRNLFAVFGGVREITWVRDGRMRCQGAFAHPILAGVFWAAVLPLIAARWWRADVNSRLLAVGGGAAALGVVVLCASSTPVLAVGMAAVAAAFFPLRHWLGWIRWAAVALLVSLHMTMNAPVWHLIARVDFVSGSTGWHRYYLIDQAIAHFDEWAVFGTESTSHWGRQLFDVTNQYILEGVRGGFISMVLFMVMLWLAFAAVGRVWRVAPGRAEVILAWALGVSLFVHATSFIAVSYFGQITMLFYLSLAMPASLLAYCRKNECAALNPHYQLQHP